MTGNPNIFRARIGSHRGHETLGHPVPADKVAEAIQARRELLLPDEHIDLRDVHIGEGFNLLISGQSVAMTPWSRAQLASMLGVNWKKWFDGNLITHAQADDEVQRRLQKLKENTAERLIRLRKPYKTGEQLPVCRGILPASTGTVPEELILETLMGHELGENIRFYRCGDQDLDAPMMSMAAVWGDPVDTKDGSYHPGIQIVNSDIGGASFMVDQWWLRLVCTNGLVVVTQKKHLYKHSHRGELSTDFRKKLPEIITRATDRIEMTRGAIDKASSEEVDRKYADIAMSRLGLLKQERAGAFGLLDDKTYPGTYGGLANAITQVARDLGFNQPHRRHVMETAAGGLLFELA